jgi:hypothetical protein
VDKKNFPAAPYTQVIEYVQFNFCKPALRRLGKQLLSDLYKVQACSEFESICGTSLPEQLSLTFNELKFPSGSTEEEIACLRSVRFGRPVLVRLNLIIYSLVFQLDILKKNLRSIFEAVDTSQTGKVTED